MLQIAFILKLETFSTIKKLEVMKHCSLTEWCMLYGRYECLTLASITTRVLSQTVSSSQCERNWTTFTLIHTKSRNNLKIDRFMHLVFCHYNMRLRERQLRRTHESEANELIDLDKIFHEDDPLQEWIKCSNFFIIQNIN
jgi:hAT family C-terminal dimerisation region